MNTKFLWVLVVILVVLIGAWFAFGRTMDAPTDTGIAPTTSEGVTDAGTSVAEARTHTVTYADDGFAPAALEIAIGDTIEFVNQSSGDLWVAADEHPTHTSYDGTSAREHCADGTNASGSFDQCARSGPGISWSYTFTKAGSFDYHNHARAADGGTVVVR